MPANKPLDPNKPVSNPESASQWDPLLLFLGRFQRFAWDVAGIIVLALSLMTLLALPAIPGLTGGLLSVWGVLLRLWFGYGTVFIALAGSIIGLLMLRQRNAEAPSINWSRVLALELATFSFMVLVAMAGGTSLERAETGLDGGRIGWGLAELLRLGLGSIGIKQIPWGYGIVGFV
jgi:S-DNA-T family DNA segregation ATPase FtsK/SpoIIIE